MWRGSARVADDRLPLLPQPSKRCSLPPTHRKDSVSAKAPEDIEPPLEMVFTVMARRPVLSFRRTSAVDEDCGLRTGFEGTKSGL